MTIVCIVIFVPRVATDFMLFVQWSPSILRLDSLSTESSPCMKICLYPKNGHSAKDYSFFARQFVLYFIMRYGLTKVLTPVEPVLRNSYLSVQYNWYIISFIICLGVLTDHSLSFWSLLQAVNWHIAILDSCTEFIWWKNISRVPSLVHN